jgi:hypothetical protein
MIVSEFCQSLTGKWKLSEKERFDAGEPAAQILASSRGVDWRRIFSNTSITRTDAHAGHIFTTAFTMPGTLSRITSLWRGPNKRRLIGINDKPSEAPA